MLSQIHDIYYSDMTFPNHKPGSAQDVRFKEIGHNNSSIIDHIYTGPIVEEPAKKHNLGPNSLAMQEPSQ